MSANATKARIIAAGQTLFNENGFAALTAVDVALYLGISPGHLYYHFKGKTEIAFALLDAHLVEVKSICDYGVRQCQTNPDLNTLWTQTHILVEEVYDLRFAYKEASAMAKSDARLEKQIKAANNLINDFCAKSIHAMAQNGAIKAKPETIDGLISQLALGIEFAHIKIAFEMAQNTPPRILIERAAAIIMLPIAGFIKPLS